MSNSLRLVVSGGFTTAEPPDTSGDYPPLIPGGIIPEPGRAPEPVPGSAGGSAVRGWLRAARGSGHLGGGSGGLAAHLADPHPEPLGTHLRHARNSLRAAMDRENDSRGTAAGKAAYHILIAIPLKLLAKTVRHGADILDWAPDNPAVLICAAVILAAITAVLLLG